MSGKKPTKVDHAQRVDKVFELLTAGLSRAQIVRFIADKTDWAVGERTIDNYIAKATEGFEAIADVDRRVMAGKAIARLDELYARSMRIQDYKVCLAIQREINSLLKLDRKWPARKEGEHAKR